MLTLLCYIYIGPKWFGCSLISDVNFARTPTTSERILSIIFLNLESHACRRKSTKQPLCQAILRKAAYVLIICVYTSHTLYWEVNLSKKLLY